MLIEKTSTDSRVLSMLSIYLSKTTPNIDEALNRS